LYTGLQLSQDLDLRVRQTQAGAYLEPSKKEYLIRMATVKLLEENYVSVVKQKSVDEISPLIKTYDQYTPNNNQVLIKPLQVTTVVLASGATFNITFDRPHNLPVGWTGLVQVSDIEGSLLFSDLNGNRTGTYVSANVISITVAGITGTHTAGTGQVSSLDNSWCSDYYHLLAISLECLKNLNLTILKVNTAGTCLITLGTNNIRQGERLKFSSFGGLTGLTGYKYVRVVSERQIKIYDDINLATPTVVTGTYTSGGVIERAHNEYCEYDISDQKISSDPPTEHFPLFDANSNRLRCYSSLRNESTFITNIKYYVDYIVKQAEIDIEDNAYDLLQIYNQEMCRLIIERAALMFFAINTSVEDVQIAPAVIR